MKLGDQFSRVTKALGFKECPLCKMRRKALNEVHYNGKPLDLALDLLQAWFTPALTLAYADLARPTKSRVKEES